MPCLDRLVDASWGGTPRFATMLPHLVIRTARTVAWVALLCSLLGMGAATVRLLPWLVSPDVPWRVSLAFFRSLALASTEVALFIALPLGCALEVVRWVADGTAATLRTLGVGPLRQATNIAVVGLAVSLMGLAVSAESANVAGAPGDLSNALVEAAGAEACRTGRAARVPLIDVAWLCSDGSPRLAGRLPTRGGAAMVWTAAHARFSKDLEQIELDDVRWSVPRPAVSIHANHVVLTGFTPWLVPNHVAPRLRSVATALVSWLAALACAWALLRWPSPSRARGLVVAVAGALSFFLVGGPLIRAASWFALPVLALLAVTVPVAVARVTAFARLPTTPAGGTKRDVVHEPTTEISDG